MSNVNLTPGQNQGALSTEGLTADDTLVFNSSASVKLDSLANSDVISKNIPTGAAHPLLQQPNPDIEPFVSTPPTAEELQKQLDQQLNNLPEYKQLLNLKKNSSSEITDYVSRYIAQKGGVPSDALVEEALAQFIQEGATSGQIDQKNATQLYNSLRVKWLSQSNPEITLLVDVLKSKYQSEGKTAEEAESLANSDILNNLDEYLADSEVKATPFSSNTATSDFLIKQLASQFQMDPDLAKQFATGIAALLQAMPEIASWFKDIAHIDPTTDIKPNPVGKGAKDFLDSADQLVDQVMKLADSLNLSPQERVSLISFLKAVANLIAELRMMLQEMEVSDSQKNKELSASQIELTKERLQVTLDQIDKNIKQIKKQSTINLIMKILMPIVSVLIMVAGILAAPFTGGATLLATLVITVALFATLTALQTTGYLQKGFEALNKAIESGMKDSPKWAKDLVVVLVYVAIIAILIVVMSKGGGGPIVNMVVMQLVSAIVSNSGMIKTTVEGISSHIDPPPSEEDMAIATAVVSALVMLVLSIFSFKMSMSAPKGDAAAGKMADFMATYGKKIAVTTEVTANLTGAAATAYQGVMEVQIGKMELGKGESEQSVELINEMIKMLQKLMKSLTESSGEMQQQATGLEEFFKSLVGGMSKIMTDMSRS